jgi:hypothetical protein
VSDVIVEFPRAKQPLVESYSDSDDLRHAEHFRCLQTRIDDCAGMSLFALQEMDRADDGKRPQLAFAVYHLAEMVCDLKRHYHAAYKGEIEP